MLLVFRFILPNCVIFDNKKHKMKLVPTVLFFFLNAKHENINKPSNQNVNVSRSKNLGRSKDNWIYLVNVRCFATLQVSCREERGKHVVTMTGNLRSRPRHLSECLQAVKLIYSFSKSGRTSAGLCSLITHLVNLIAQVLQFLLYFYLTFFCLVFFLIS